MIDRKHRMKPTARGLGMLAALALLATAWFGAVTSVAAQGDSEQSGPMVIGVTINCDGTSGAPCWPADGVQVSVTTEGGDSLGSCTVTRIPNDPSHIPACTVQVPIGTTVIVTEDVSTLTAGYAPEQNPIPFDTTQLGRASHDVVFRNVPQGGNASTSQTSNVAIATTENGQPATDVCYVLVNFSNEGCDANQDGQVTFQDVPLGTYTVHQTADLGPGRKVDDFTIQVTGNMQYGWETFETNVVDTPGTSSTSGSLGSSGPVDIALITRDPQDGHLLTGTCYVLLNYSNEGCDENGDGQVTFADVPSGTYTVHQTRTPAGYPTINDYPINVEPVRGLPGGGAGGPLGFIVKQAPQQNAPNTRNISILLFNSRTGEKVTGLCAQIIDVSNVGCDEDLVDGQIDFLDVQAGTYEVRFDDLPPAYMVLTGDRGIPLTIDTGAGAPTDQFLYLLVYVPD